MRNVMLKNEEPFGLPKADFDFLARHSAFVADRLYPIFTPRELSHIVSATEAAAFLFIASQEVFSIAMVRPKVHDAKAAFWRSATCRRIVHFLPSIITHGNPSITSHVIRRGQAGCLFGALALRWRWFFAHDFGVLLATRMRSSFGLLSWKFFTPTNRHQSALPVMPQRSHQMSKPRISWETAESDEAASETDQSCPNIRHQNRTMALELTPRGDAVLFVNSVLISRPSGLAHLGCSASSVRSASRSPHRRLRRFRRTLRMFLRARGR